MTGKLIKECGAEFIGTFALVFFGCGSMILHELNPDVISPDSIPIIFGGIIAVMIYTLGHISGAHFNPAVSIAFYSVGFVDIKKVASFPFSIDPQYLSIPKILAAFNVIAAIASS